jgi:hypothetical protein
LASFRYLVVWGGSIPLHFWVDHDSLDHRWQHRISKLCKPPGNFPGCRDGCPVYSDGDRLSQLEEPIQVHVHFHCVVFGRYFGNRYDQFWLAKIVASVFVNIQPADLSKIVIILVLAHYFSNSINKPKNVRWMALSAILLAGIVLPIYLQPNLSTTILLVVIWFAMLWISGLPMKYVVIMGIVGVIAAIVVFPFLEGYQQERILTFFQPAEEDYYGNT